jgi:hypothetical protein
VSRAIIPEVFLTAKAQRWDPAVVLMRILLSAEVDERDTSI